MYFQLLKVILWPRSGGEPRVLEFKPGVVNVISGASKTGKSAVIPVIDYCLASDKCAIPVGVIREACSWFGILVDTLEGQKLLARREPGDQQSTSDMVLLEGPKIEVPPRIEVRTSNADAVKAMLNRLAGVPNLGFEPSSEAGSKNRPSFRDLVAFMFQPQNIVANPDVLFFKADTTEHREKLRTIFPYVLGAVTAEVLEARHELDRLSKELRRKEGELKALQATSESWRREAQAWLRQAVELGLYAAKAAIPEAWPDTLDALRGVLEAEPQAFAQSVEGIETVLTRLADLRDQEVKLTAELRQHRERLNELKALSESGEDYVHSLRVQRDRLSLSSWIRERYWQGAAAKALDGDGQEKVEALCQALESLEVQLRSFPVASETLSRETLRQRAATQGTLDELNIVRREVQSLETRSEAVRQMTSQSEQVQRFLGRLEEVLRVYDAADASSELRGDVEELRRRVKALTDQVREFEIRRRMDLALAQVHGNASKMLPLLDGEWSDAPIRLMVQDLTIKVIRGNREDYLWEVGSGANWLAYHVSVTLALQKFFLTSPNHPVPSMLVYDQPSQVYFPARRSSATEQSTEPTRWFDEDIVAVRKVFSLLASEADAANGRLQIVVLDHADSEVWGTVSGIHLVEEWRGEALVPQAWLQP